MDTNNSNQALRNATSRVTQVTGKEDEKRYLPRSSSTYCGVIYLSLSPDDDARDNLRAPDNTSFQV